MNQDEAVDFGQDVEEENEHENTPEVAPGDEFDFSEDFPERVVVEDELEPAIPSSDTESPSTDDFEKHLQREISVEIADTRRFLNYALVHNQIPLFSGVVVSNAGENRSHADIHVEIVIDGDVVGRGIREDVELDADSEVPISASELPLRLSPRRMLSVEWNSPAEIRARVVWNQKVIAEHVVSTTVLSSRQWVGALSVASGTGHSGFDPLSLMMLSAFVQPQHPAIRDLVGEAYPHLVAMGLSSFHGYQSRDSKQVDLMVRAIGEAFRARGVVYHNPEPGWINEGTPGQIIRTPEDVLVGREGTCLDTTVVLAAALERVGIHPLIVVIEGHAFLGYWRQEALFDQGFVADKSTLSAKIASGAFGFVETTMCTAGNESESWESIQEHPLEKRLKRDLSNLQGFIDIRASREVDGVYPVPARVEIDGEVQLFIHGSDELRQAREHLIRVEKGDSGESIEREPTPPRVQFWKNSLLDLSLRNALINYREQRGVRLLVPVNNVAQFEDVFSAGQVISLSPQDSLPQAWLERGVTKAGDLPDDFRAEMLFSHSRLFTTMNEKPLDQAMTRLQYRARTYRQETGASNLYVTVGALKWTFKGVALSSPLILVPAKVERVAKSGEHRIVLDDTGESTPNFSLLEKLRRELGLELPEVWSPTADQSGIDIEKTFASVAEVLSKEGYGHFSVDFEVHLALLQFSKFRLWKDLDEHWEAFVENPVVNHLALKSHEIFEDPHQEVDEGNFDELLLGCPLPADSSQLRAITHAIGGRSFVLEGPPGTGKSQTITNMLARAMVEGKKVLFVAEKSQALSVVKKRLDAVGLGALSLDIHDKSSSTTEIKAQILAALDATEAFDQASLEDSLRALDGAEKLLGKYAERLGEENHAGFTLYEALMDALSPREGVTPFEVPEDFVATATAEDFATLRNVCASLIDLEGSVRLGPQSGWRFISRVIEDQDTSALFERVDALTRAVVDARGRVNLGSVLPLMRGPLDVHRVVWTLSSFDITRTHLEECLTVRWEKALEGILQDCEVAGRSAHPALATFTPEVLDQDLSQLAFTVATAASQGFFQKRKTLKSVVGQLTLVARPGQKIKADRLDSYVAVINSLADSATELRRRAESVLSVTLPERWNPLVSTGRQQLEESADSLRENARYFLDQTEWHKTALDLLMSSRETLSSSDLSALQSLDEELSQLVTEFGISDEDMTDWSADSDLCTVWTQTTAARGESLANRQSTLRSWMGLVSALEPFSTLGFYQMRAQILNGAVRLSDATLAFENGVAVASVNERVSTLGLTEFDGANHDVQVNRYARSLARLRELLPASLSQRVLSRRPFDASSSRGRIAQLRTQVTKKRGGLTIRALFNEFSDIIPNLLPCVMTNPDSIARLFPPRASQFDLVIFDEASQIRVAEAIGAMGRSRSVVVVGDTRQMPPTSFARVSDDLGDTDEVESMAELEGQLGDQESLLDECKDALTHPLELTWHYRSQDESLIAFSNRTYYERKLSSFPTPFAQSAGKPTGIDFVKVEPGSAPTAFLSKMKNIRGELPKSSRVNLDEVFAIVEEVKQRFKASPDTVPSIGIVTFNLEQRGLIERALNLLNDERIGAALNDDDGVFVKNIEFVQGDERDIILFSIGRVPAADGRVSLTGFGPLTQRGGHRRLNVAITRARQQVRLFSSFDPGQLPAEDASNQGLKDLKAYLQWAYSGDLSGVHADVRRPIRDSYRDDLAGVLGDEGYDVMSDLGLSDFRIDLSVTLPGHGPESAVGILLDGPLWRKRGTIFDRDVLPVDILRGLMGWRRIVRVWVPEWLRDRDAVLARIRVATTAASEDLEEIEPTVESQDPLFELPDLSESDRESVPRTRAVLQGDSESMAEFIPWTGTGLGSRDFLDYLPRHPRAVEGVQSMMREIVEWEGPVEFSRLARLTAAAFGLTKVNSSREATLRSVIPRDVAKTPDEDVAWPASTDPETWRGFRASQDYAARPLEVVSKREIVNAMAFQANRALGMRREDLYRETLQTFGGKRITAGIEALLEAALAWGLSNNRLREDTSGHLLGT